MRHLIILSLFTAACVVTPAPGPTTPPPASAPPPTSPMPPPVTAVSPGGAVLTGRVIDARTHQPLAKAAIDVVSNVSHDHFTVLTDADGHYTTRPIAPGDFAVRARASGYESLNRGLNVGNTEARLDFELQPLH